MCNRMLRYLALCSFFAMLLLQVGCTATSNARNATRDGVFVHIKSGLDQPHSVMMALRMAQMMSDDYDVLVYFDVDGINAVLQGAPELKMEPFGSSHAMIQDLAARNVPLYACLGCLQAQGKTEGHLMPGIMIAQKQAFFTFTQGRILTLDY